MIIDDDDIYLQPTSGEISNKVNKGGAVLFSKHPIVRADN